VADSVSIRRTRAVMGKVEVGGNNFGEGLYMETDEVTQEAAGYSNVQCRGEKVGSGDRCVI
jgi:hypothetical protein